MTTWRAIWLMDSGANYNIYNNRVVFTSLSKRSKSIDVSIGHGSVLRAKYEGNINLNPTTDYEKCELTLCDVLYIPQASVNLISVSHAAVSRYGM